VPWKSHAENAQEIRSASKNWRRLWKSVFLAQEVGEGLGTSENVFGPLRGRITPQGSGNRQSLGPTIGVGAFRPRPRICDHAYQGLKNLPFGLKLTRNLAGSAAGPLFWRYNQCANGFALREAVLATVFFSYCHADEALRDQIEKQLSLLKRQGVVETWHDRRIEAGQEFAAEIDRHIETDDIILLLVSADFLASDYCYEIELKRAMERHETGDAIVIPVILRACDWHGAPFGKINATPPDGKPITQFPDRDQE
jgi:hypothetical protein